MSNLEDHIIEQDRITEEWEQRRRERSDAMIRYARADRLCDYFMAMRPDLAPMSLDAWMIEHDAKLSPAERAAGYAIMALHPDYSAGNGEV